MNDEDPHPPLTLMEDVSSARVEAPGRIRDAATRFVAMNDAFNMTYAAVKREEPGYEDYEMTDWEADIVGIFDADFEMEALVRACLREPSSESEDRALLAIQRAIDTRRPWTKAPS